MLARNVPFNGLPAIAGPIIGEMPPAELTADLSADPTSISVKLPDGTTRQLPAGSTGADLAASIGPRLAQAAIAVLVDGVERDLEAPLPDGSSVSVITAASARAEKSCGTPRPT